MAMLIFLESENVRSVVQLIEPDTTFQLDMSDFCFIYRELLVITEEHCRDKFGHLQGATWFGPLDSRFICLNSGESNLC